MRILVTRSCMREFFGKELLFFFCILMNFYFVMYYTWEKYKKRKGKLNIYTSQTNTQLHTYKKETNKTNPSTFFSIYMKKKVK